MAPSPTGETWSSGFITAIGPEAESDHRTGDLATLWYKDKRLLTFLPETCATNLMILARLLDLPLSKTLQMALRSPSLLYQKPETVYGRAVRIAQALSITPTRFIKMAQSNLSVVECFETVCGVSERRVGLIWVGC